MGKLAARFHSLGPQHFDYLSQPAESRDHAVRDEILGILIGLWGVVAGRLPAPLVSQLGEIHAGDIKATDGGAWAQTGKEQGKDVVNLTIEMQPDWIDLNIVGGTKPQADRLEKWLRGAGSFWRENEDFELQVFRRSANTKGSKPVWQGAAWYPIRGYAATEVARVGFTSIRIENQRQIDDDSENLAYHVKRKWSKDEAFGAPGPWLHELSNRAEVLVPLLREINAPRAW